MFAPALFLLALQLMAQCLNEYWDEAGDRRTERIDDEAVDLSGTLHLIVVSDALGQITEPSADMMALGSDLVAVRVTLPTRRPTCTS